MNIVDDSIERYAFENTRREPENLRDLAALTRERMELPQMLTGRVEGRLLKMLVQLSRPRLVLEIGTFTGYSALSMAEGLGEEGRIITCEVDPEARRVAQTAFDASPVGHRIELRFGPALDTLRDIDEPLDFTFIDADKTAYLAYYDEVVPRTRQGGLIVLDNMLWSGEVLDPQSDSARALATLNERIATDERVENVLLTVRDGVQLARKR